MPPSPPNNARTLLLVIVLGLCAWGIFHVVGAYESTNPVRYDWRRSAVVAVCFAAFLGFWGSMLWMRQARLKREAPRSERRHRDDTQ